ncbi:MAG: hypothetical protein LBF89_08170 [Bacteroidales bacterium]|jgi:hypothetical protein|nr:hypothetical protein [Bacteroidales bacterium]
MGKKYLIACFIVVLMVGLLIDKSITKESVSRYFYHFSLDSAILYTSYPATDVTDIENKFTASPVFLTSYLQKYKTIKDSILVNYICSRKETDDFLFLFQFMPQMIKKTLEKKLIGIYFYRNMATDGHLHLVYNNNI